MTTTEQSDFGKFFLVLPILAKQQGELPAFIEKHSWFTKRNGRIFVKSSGDFTEQTLALISSSQIIVDIRQDKSIYDAWNQCLDGLATIGLENNSYITFVGIDDLLSETYANAALAAVELQPDLNFIYGDSCHDLHGVSYEHKSPTNPKLFGKNYFLFDVPHPGMFNRWETIKDHRFDTQFRLAADFDFYIGIALSQQVKWKKLDVIQATLGGEGISGSLNSKQIYLKEWVIIEAKHGVQLGSNKLHTAVTAWISKSPLIYKWLRKTWWRIKSLTR